MLSWIPLLGPILQGIGSIYTTFTSKEIAQIQATTTTTVAETQASVAIIQTNAANIGLRIITDMICAPVAVWTMLLSWDTIVAKHWPNLMWHTANYPPSVSYLPYAVLTFLLGNVGINMWNRK